MRWAWVEPALACMLAGAIAAEEADPFAWRPPAAAPAPRERLTPEEYAARVERLRGTLAPGQLRRADPPRASVAFGSDGSLASFVLDLDARPVRFPSQLYGARGGKRQVTMTGDDGGRSTQIELADLGHFWAASRRAAVWLDAADHDARHDGEVLVAVARARMDPDLAETALARAGAAGCASPCIDALAAIACTSAWRHDEALAFAHAAMARLPEDDACEVADCAFRSALATGRIDVAIGVADRFAGLLPRPSDRAGLVAAAEAWRAMPVAQRTADPLVPWASLDDGAADGASIASDLAAPGVFRAVRRVGAMLVHEDQTIDLDPLAAHVEMSFVFVPNSPGAPFFRLGLRDAKRREAVLVSLKCEHIVEPSGLGGPQFALERRRPDGAAGAYRCRLLLRGQRLTLWIDGRRVVDTPFAAPAAERRMGCFVTSKATGELRDLTYRWLASRP